MPTTTLQHHLVNYLIYAPWSVSRVPKSSVSRVVRIPRSELELELCALIKVNPFQEDNHDDTAWLRRSDTYMYIYIIEGAGVGWWIRFEAS